MIMELQLMKLVTLLDIKISQSLSNCPNDSKLFLNQNVYLKNQKENIWQWLHFYARVLLFYPTLKIHQYQKLNIWGAPGWLSWLSMGLHFVVREFEPHMGLWIDGAEPAWDFLSPSLSLSHSLSLPLKINKLFKKEIK